MRHRTVIPCDSKAHWLTQSCTYSYVTHAGWRVSHFDISCLLVFHPSVFFLVFSSHVEAAVLDESACMSARALASPETCHTHLQRTSSPVDACKMCENTSWNGLVFLHVRRLKTSSLFSGWTREHRLCFRHLALPRHAATAFTSSGQRSRGQWPRWGSGYGVFLPAVSWCVVWFVLSGMWLYKSQRAICWRYGFNPFLFSYCSVWPFRLQESVKHTCYYSFVKKNAHKCASGHCK